MTDAATASLASAARALRAHAVSAEELVEDAIRRHLADERLHAYKHFDAAGARMGARAADEILIETLIDADADAFFRRIAAEGDRRNICGLPPIYLTLRLLSGNARGELTGYDRCPADGQHTSFVSVCGMVFHKRR